MIFGSFGCLLNTEGIPRSVGGHGPRCMISRASATKHEESAAAAAAAYASRGWGSQAPRVHHGGEGG